MKLCLPNTGAAMPSLEILPGRFIDARSPCFFIAEIGQNHQGSFEEAKNLIQAARVRTFFP